MISSAPPPASPPSSSSSSGSQGGSVLGTDPLAGLGSDLDACTPHHHSLGAHSLHDHDGPQTSGGFMCPTRMEDPTAIGQVQTATMLAPLQVGHTVEHSAPLPQGIRGMIAAPVVAASWEVTVAKPPSPGHHVLVAIATQADVASRMVVSLLGLAPTQSMDAGRHLNEAGIQAMEITALDMEPASQRRGYGSRLLAAAADLTRQDGARALVARAVRGDQSVSQFLSSMGMAPAGAHRVLDIGEGIAEDYWAASL